MIDEFIANEFRAGRIKRESFTENNLEILSACALPAEGRFFIRLLH